MNKKEEDRKLPKKITKKNASKVVLDLCEWEPSQAKGYDQLQQELVELEGKLLDVPEFRALQEKSDLYYRACRALQVPIQAEARKIKRKIAKAKECTPELLERLKKLIKEIERSNGLEILPGMGDQKDAEASI